MRSVPNAWVIGLVMVLLATLVSTGVGAAPSPALEQAVTAITPLIPYQGRLLDPATGKPKADGTYTMTFRIYDAATGGTALWTETKDVAVSKGLFTTYLGDTTPLAPAIFDGNDRWLGVKVGADPETTPRMRLAFVPYTFWALNADTLDGQDAAAFAAAGHNHDAAYVNDNAGEVDNADVVDGALSPAKINGTAWTSANDGPGSGLDADTLDGNDASAFAAAGHTHTGADIADGSIETADLADGAVTAAKLAAGVVPKYIDLNIYSAYLEGTAAFADGFTSPGINIPDGTSIGSFALSFVLPPDYSSGDTVYLHVYWHTPATNCQLTLLPNFMHVSREGTVRIHGGGSVTRGLDGVGGNVLTAPSTAYMTQVKDYTITTPDPSVPLQAGDVIVFGLYRSPTHSSDTCADTLVIKGMTATY